VKLKDLNRQIISCRKCPRLVAWREAVAAEKRRAYRDWEYWGKPVPGFGDAHARVLVVGLAPGAHGSNRTGRQFTGDASGDFLFPALHRAGYASRPFSTSRDDGLRLKGLYLTAAARCAPPANRPTPQELANCQLYLEREIELTKPRVLVCLGRIAFERVLRIFSIHPSMFRFRHGAHYRLENANPGLRSGEAALPAAVWLVCSYHPSQQNTLTGKLTRRMFSRVWTKARELSEHD
jgi:uracil-DNA glycosylase family 4